MSMETHFGSFAPQSHGLTGCWNRILPGVSPLVMPVRALKI